jgi:hypothetical protein
MVKACDDDNPSGGCERVYCDLKARPSDSGGVERGVRPASVRNPEDGLRGIFFARIDNQVCAELQRQLLRTSLSSLTMTGPEPWALRQSNRLNPMGPAPTRRAVPPSGRTAVFTACHATAKG